MPRQTTIKKSVSLKGVGIHTGTDVTLTFKPAEENYGYVFQRIDLPEKPFIEATITILSLLKVGYKSFLLMVVDIIGFILTQTIMYLDFTF